MATLSIQNISESGLNATYSAAASGGDTFTNPNNDRTFLHVKNGDATSKTVTVAATKSSFKLPGIGVVAKNDISVAVPAGAERMIGPIPPDSFGKSPAITYSAVTSVTIAVIRLPATGQ